MHHFGIHNTPRATCTASFLTLLLEFSQSIYISHEILSFPVLISLNVSKPAVSRQQIAHNWLIRLDISSRWQQHTATQPPAHAPLLYSIGQLPYHRLILFRVYQNSKKSLVDQIQQNGMFVVIYRPLPVFLANTIYQDYSQEHTQYQAGERRTYSEMRQKPAPRDTYTFFSLIKDHQQGRPTSVATEFVDTDWDEEEGLFTDAEDNSPRGSFQSVSSLSF